MISLLSTYHVNTFVKVKRSARLCCPVGLVFLNTDLEIVNIADQRRRQRVCHIGFIFVQMNATMQTSIRNQNLQTTTKTHVKMKTISKELGHALLLQPLCADLLKTSICHYYATSYRYESVSLLYHT